jgi:hypothetical protein
MYPRVFHAIYAEEMSAVFRMKLCDAAHHGYVAVSLTLLREVLDLPYSIIREHLRKDREPMHWLQLRGPQNVRRARNLTRAASLVVAFLVNWTLIQILTRPDYNLWSQSVPFVSTLFVTNLLMLVAWRWERLGARLVLLGALGVGLTVAYSVFVTASAKNIEISALLMLFIGAAWAFPYILFGLLFLNFSRHQTPFPSSA